MHWANGQPPDGIKIGDPFPKSDLILGTSRGAWAMLAGPTVVFVVVVPELGPDDLPGFTQPPVTVGLACERDVVFLLLDFAGWIVAEAWMDPFMHAQSVRDEFLTADQTPQNMPVVLVQGNGQLIRGIRILPLRRTMADEIRHLYGKSHERHANQRAVHRTVELIEQSHSEAGDLFDRATMHEVFI